MFPLVRSTRAGHHVAKKSGGSALLTKSTRRLNHEKHDIHYIQKGHEVFQVRIHVLQVRWYISSRQQTN